MNTLSPPWMVQPGAGLDGQRNVWSLVSVTVEFSSSLKAIPYSVRVLTGSGAR